MCNMPEGQNSWKEERNAVCNKVTRLVESGLERLQNLTNDNIANISTDASAVTEKLFKNMTKAEIIEGILDDDVLSFKNLLEREDVQIALEKTKELYYTAVNDTVQLGIKIYELERDITELGEAIKEDVIIFGITNGVRKKLKQLEDMVKLKNL